mgnify:CR=1 FL=1
MRPHLRDVGGHLDGFQRLASFEGLTADGGEVGGEADGLQSLAVLEGGVANLFHTVGDRYCDEVATAKEAVLADGGDVFGQVGLCESFGA